MNKNLDTIKEYPKCTRVEVIDENGRSYVNWKPTNKVKVFMQDKGKTMKIFISSLPNCLA